MRYLLVILLLCLPSQAQAWTCFNLKTHEQKYLYVHDYEIIFKGKVASIRDMSAEELHRHYPDKDATWQYTPQIATFEIEKKYKGILGDTIEVQDFSGNSPYSTHYEVGESYYVFANEKNELVTPMGCVGSLYGMEDSTQAQITLEKLRAEAEMYAKRADELPYDRSKYMQYSRFYLEQARFHESFNDFPPALVAYQKALEVLTDYSEKDVIDTNPDELIFLDIGYLELFKLGIGRIYYKQGKYEDALKIFEKITDNLEKFEKLVDESQDTLREAKKYRDLTLAEIEKQNP